MRRQRRQNEETEEYVPNKSIKQNKTKKTERKLNKMEINNLPDKEFKVMIIRMLTELKRSMDERRENFKKNILKFFKNQSELKNAITSMNNTSEGIHSRIADAEKQVSDMEDRVVKNHPIKKEKGISKMWRV